MAKNKKVMSLAIDPALHRPDLAPADPGDLLVRQAVDGDEHQDLTMRSAQGAKSALEGRDLDPAVLLGGHPIVALEVVIRHLGGDMLAGDQAAKAVAQDGEQPCLEVGARRKLVLCLQRVDDRVLNDVVGEMNVSAREAARERPQMGNEGRDLLLEHVHDPPSL